MYLNIPDLSQPSTAIWSRRSFSTATLEAELAARNLPFDPGAIPLARHSTLSEVVTQHCWTWNRLTCDWNPPHDCGTSTTQMTFTEWELNDINGDGYPDVVMNSSPVAMVPSGSGGPPADPPTCNMPATGKTTSRVTPTLPAINEIDGMINVLGVHVELDSQPFSAPALLRGPDTCGVAKWAETDSTHQSLLCGILDVNGDQVADRVNGGSVRLGTGADAFGAGGMFMSGAQLTLPGALAIHQSDEFPVCSPGAAGNTHFNTHLTAGLRDLTGDGIPDYVAQDSSNRWSVAIGTGTGFLPSIPIDGEFALSLQDETCNGNLSSATTGLYDVDGDGKPDVVTANPATGAAFVNKLVGSGGVFGAPEAGRLIQMDNAFGAITNITYRSAKLLIDQDPSARAATSIHQVPFPEVVVSSIETVKTQSPSVTLLAKTRYAYGGAQLLFDAVGDTFYFPGYRRQVALRVPTEQTDGLATITDTYSPDSPFDPFAGASSPDQRFARVLRHGRVSDVTVLRGNLGTDPSQLLAVNVASDARRIANTHYEYDAKLLPPATGTGVC
ncbi:MAG: toxin TcdB middle/N-terminal domain-containing protein, partial [bacterium]